MKSMTGYGFAEMQKEEYSCKIKLHSVNQRYFEAILRLPHDLIILEGKIKKTVQKSTSRGRINIFIELSSEKAQLNSKIDMNAARVYHNLIKELNDEFNLENKGVRALDLLKLKEVIKHENASYDIDKTWTLIKETLDQALSIFNDMRIKEGDKLREDITLRLGILQKINDEIKTLREGLKSIYQEKLHKRLKELVPDVPINENIVKLEIASFVDKSDITEEIVRIDSHLSQFNSILSNNKPIGRQMDFISQELNREFNTIGSKANSYDISDKVIQAKCELEKIREQLQNVE